MTRRLPFIIAGAALTLGIFTCVLVFGCAPRRSDGRIDDRWFDIGKLIVQALVFGLVSSLVLEMVRQTAQWKNTRIELVRDFRDRMIKAYNGVKKQRRALRDNPGNYQDALGELTELQLEFEGLGEQSKELFADNVRAALASMEKYLNEVIDELREKGAHVATGAYESFLAKYQKDSPFAERFSHQKDRVLQALFDDLSGAGPR